MWLGFPRETSTVYINGENGVYAGVTKQSGANTVVVANAVYKKLAAIQTLFPEDVSMEIVENKTTDIWDVINELVK